MFELINQIPEIAPYWIDNENERKKHFSSIIRSGQRADIIAIIKSIYEHSKGLKEKGRKLHACDEISCKDAEKLIYEEFSYVLDIEKKDVQMLISKAIKNE